ncbi:GDP-L-fucose synthase, partial [bacterium]|nr:GDP-L-fucose synthase [bacterium]
IKELGETIQTITGHKGDIIWDTTKPDGTPRKLMDSNKMFKLGWTPEYDLKTGINHTYNWFLKHQDQFKEVKL